MINAHLSDFVSCWHGLAPPGALPLYADLHPRSLAPFMPRLIVLERTAPGDARILLAGSAVCAEFGRELGGGSFGSLWSERDRKDVSRLIDIVFDEAEALRIAAKALRVESTPTDLEFAFVPLARPTQGKQRLLGCCTSTETRFTQFDSMGDRIAELHLTSVRMLERDFQSPPHQSTGIAAAGLPMADVTLRRGHLVLIRGGNALEPASTYGSSVIRR